MIWFTLNIKNKLKIYKPSQMIKQRRHSVLPFYLQGCVTKCKTDIRYDMFWYSIRIYKVLIALQSMAPCGFIDGLRKNSDVPGHDRCCGFCICIYQPPALPAPGGATATTATHQHQQQKQQHSHKSNSDSNRRKQQRTNSSNLRILDFWISDFGFPISDFWFWIGLLFVLLLAAPNSPLGLWISGLGSAIFAQVWVLHEIYKTTRIRVSEDIQ